MIDVAEAYGLRFEFPAGDTAVGACLRDYGEFARPELDLLTLLTTGAVMDVGANIGAICLPLAKARPTSAVIAIEAHPGLAAILQGNVAANGLSNVAVIEAAAGEAEKTIQVPVAPLHGASNYGALSLYDHGPTRSCRMLRLDDLAPEKTSAVKIDVEGFEPRVLAGANYLLHDQRPAWLIEVSQRRADAALEVRDRMRRAGYSLFWFFSPFLTRRRPRRLDERPKMRGDISILALDTEPPWPMQPVSDEWPRDVADFPYLSDYGLISAMPQKPR